MVLFLNLATTTEAVKPGDMVLALATTLEIATDTSRLVEVAMVLFLSLVMVVEAVRPVVMALM